MLSILTIVSVSGCLESTPAPPAPSEGPYTVRITVKDGTDGTPISRALVTMGVTSDTTNELGIVALTVPKGSISISVIKDGYKNYVSSTTVTSDISFSISMTRGSSGGGGTTLAVIWVTGKLHTASMNGNYYFESPISWYETTGCQDVATPSGNIKIVGTITATNTKVVWTKTTFVQLDSGIFDNSAYFELQFCGIAPGTDYDCKLTAYKGNTIVAVYSF
ncbi:MAG: hypothetical protein IMZ64_06220 [Bacteroidetes bacterium]|nr:hypothetical protein [Bacteroidota bacterium]